MYFIAYAAPIPTFSNQSFFTGPGGGIGKRNGLKNFLWDSDNK